MKCCFWYGQTGEPQIFLPVLEIKRIGVTDVNSDVYAVNHSDGQAVAVDMKTAELLSFAFHMAEKRMYIRTGNLPGFGGMGIYDA